MAVTNITQTISTIPMAGKRGVDVQTIFVNKQEAFQDALTDVFVGQINTLRTQLNTFAGQVNTTATQVNTDATSASTSATTATTKASEASTSASQALTSRNQAETFAQQAQASASSVDANNIVHRTGDENIAGVKTFSSSPIVPTPTTGTQAVNKNYVEEYAMNKVALYVTNLDTIYTSGVYTTIPNATTGQPLNSWGDLLVMGVSIESSITTQVISYIYNQGVYYRSRANRVWSDWQKLATETEMNTLNSQNVKLTGNQTIAGVKTFSSSPIVPTPTTGTQAVNKNYVDNNSAVLQVVYAENKVVGSGSLTIPADGTIPQITEGNEILTCTITPKKANSRLLIEFAPSCQEASNVSELLTVACFRNGVSGALYQTASNAGGDDNFAENNITGRFIIDTPTTSPLTFSLRAGMNAGSTSWNKIKYGSTFNNTSTTMTITEIA